MAYLSGRGRFDYKVEVGAMATDIARAIPSAAAVVRDAWRADILLDGVRVGMEADSCHGVAAAKVSPVEVDFPVYAPRGPVQEHETEFVLDPRRGLDGLVEDLRASLAEAAPLLDAMRAYAGRRRRVASGPGEWMGLLRIDGCPVELRKGFAGLRILDREARHPTFYSDHAPRDPNGETPFFQIVQWSMGRGDNPHFHAAMTPGQLAAADCLCQRVPRTREERAEADRALADGRDREWVLVLPLPPLAPLPAEEETQPSVRLVRRPGSLFKEPFPEWDDI